MGQSSCCIEHCTHSACTVDMHHKMSRRQGSVQTLIYLKNWQQVTVASRGPPVLSRGCVRLRKGGSRSCLLLRAGTAWGQLSCCCHTAHRGRSATQTGH